jgi:putative sterol carrier protein
MTEPSTAPAHPPEADPAGPHAPFSPGWAAAFHAAIEGDATYREAASGWKWPLALVMEAEPALGFATAVGVEATLERGRSHGVRAVTDVGAVEAPFVLRGSYETWKAVMREGLDPVMAVATGRLALERGALTTLMLHTRSARLLVELARQVPTRFPDEG